MQKLLSTKKMFMAVAAVVGIAAGVSVPGAYALSMDSVGFTVDGKAVNQNGDTQTGHLQFQSQDQFKNIGIDANTGNRQGNATTDAGVTVISLDQFKIVMAHLAASHNDSQGSTQDGHLTIAGQDTWKNVQLQSAFFGKNADGSVQSGDAALAGQDFLNKLQGSGGVFVQSADGSINNTDLSFFFK